MFSKSIFRRPAALVEMVDLLAEYRSSGAYEEARAKSFNGHRFSWPKLIRS
jgi:hypothetical protein